MDDMDACRNRGKLALARIHHRLKLTKEAGLEVPRLEVLLQKTKRLSCPCSLFLFACVQGFKACRVFGGFHNHRE